MPIFYDIKQDKLYKLGFEEGVKQAKEQAFKEWLKQLVDA